MHKIYYTFHDLPDELLFLIASFLETPPLVSKQLYCAYLSHLAHQIMAENSNSYKNLKTGNKLAWYLTQFLRMQTKIFNHTQKPTSTSRSLNYLSNKLYDIEKRALHNRSDGDQDKMTQLSLKISALRIGLQLRLNTTTPDEIKLLNALSLNYTLKGLAIICLSPLLPQNILRQKAAIFYVRIVKNMAFPPEMAAYISPTTFDWLLNIASNHKDIEIKKIAKKAFKDFILQQPKLCHNIDINTLITEGKNNNYGILNIVAQHAASEFREQHLQALIKILEITPTDNIHEHSAIQDAITHLAKSVPTLFKRNNLVSFVNIAQRSGSTYTAHLTFSLICNISKHLVTLFDDDIITLLINVTNKATPYLCPSQGYDTLRELAEIAPEKFSISHIQNIISHTEKRHISSYTNTNFDILFILTNKRKYLFHTKIQSAIRERLNNTINLIYIEKIQNVLHAFIDLSKISSEFIDSNTFLLTSDSRAQQQKSFNDLNFLAEKAPLNFSDKQISQIVNLCHHTSNMIRLNAVKLSMSLMKHKSSYSLSDFLFTVLNLLKDSDRDIRNTVKWQIIYHYSDALTSAHFEMVGALITTYDETNLNTILEILAHFITKKYHLFDAKCKTLVTDTLILSTIYKSKNQQANLHTAAIYSFSNIARLQSRILSSAHVNHIISALENNLTSELLYILKVIALDAPSLLPNNSLGLITKNLTATNTSSYQLSQLETIYKAQPRLFHYAQLASLLNLLDSSNNSIKRQCYLTLTAIAISHPDAFNEETLESLSNRPSSSREEAEAKSYLEAVLVVSNQYALEQNAGAFDSQTLLSAYQEAPKIEPPKDISQKTMQQATPPEEIITEKSEATLENNQNTFFSITNWIKPLAEWLVPGCNSIS